MELYFNQQFWAITLHHIIIIKHILVKYKQQIQQM